MVLDSAAVLALILDEPGADRVFESLNHAVLGMLNLAEVVSVLCRRGVASEGIIASIDALSITLLPIDEELAFATGLLALASRAYGLSLGDRACLALARRENATVLTTDGRMRELGMSIGIDVQLIR